MPLQRNTDAEFAPSLTVAKSRRASPLKSPVSMSIGWSPVATFWEPPMTRPKFASKDAVTSLRPPKRLADVTARSDGDAVRSVWLGALLYLPISALLFFIGTHTAIVPRVNL